MKTLYTSMCIGLYSNTLIKSVKASISNSLLWLIFMGFFFLTQSVTAQTTIGPINMGNLTDYLFVFTDANADANWQGATKGFVGNVAIDGIQAAERTSGGVPYAGTISTNDGSLGAWQNIVTQNAGQATASTGQTTQLTQLESQLNNAFTQINALSTTAGYSSVSSTSLNGLNTQNSIVETFVINITSGLGFSSKINITGDAGDVFILRWDSDGNPNNGYQGEVKPQSGGAIVPLGGLKPSNFINVAGNINSSGGGSNPSGPYPQGPRLNNGTGALISGASDFGGGGFFTGYWLTTGDPLTGKTSPLSNGIFVGGWYSKTTEFSMTSGTSGVYVGPEANCTCPNNLVQNPSFENGGTNWSSSGGNFTQATYAAVCGTYAGHFQITNTSNNRVTQTIASGTISSGTSLLLKVYAGTHNPSFNHYVAIQYFKSDWTYISENAVAVNSMLPTMTEYTINGTVPANTYYITVAFSGNGDWIKTDNWCLTSSCSNVTSGGTIGSNQNSCSSSFTPATLTNVTSPSGGSGTLEYLWLKSTTTCIAPNGTNDAEWSPISGTNSATYSPPALSQNTCFLRCSRRAGCTNYDGESNVVSITLSGPPVVLAQSELNLVKTRTITNEILCGNTAVSRVFYADCLLDNAPNPTAPNINYWKIIGGGEFKEYCDGTARVDMQIQNLAVATYKFNFSLVFTGRTYTAPSGSPHIEGCTTVAAGNWYYYTGSNGSLIGIEGLAGGNISVSRSMTSFQLGTNASLYQSVLGQFGASGWLNSAIISQPTAFNFAPSCQMDLNFYLSGGDLTSTQASACGKICSGASTTLTAYAVGGKPNYTYSWSGGGNSQTKSVNPSVTTTYTVTITDANSCTSIDEVVITVAPPPTVSAGADANICGNQSIILTASGAGGTPGYTYNWNNGLGAGSSKTVSPTVTTTYIVTVTDALGCTATDNVVVTVGASATVDIGPDMTICNGDQTVINSTVTGIPTCGTPGITNCNNTLATSGGWLENPPASTICGDNAGTKLWTQSGQGTSFITLDFGSVLPVGTTLCFNTKLEHCNNSSSSNSDARIETSLAVGTGFSTLVASRLFSNPTYSEFCYTITSTARYVKISDNGKCAFRVDYVKYTTPNTFNNTITYFWSGPGILGSTTGPSIIANASGTYTLVVTDCTGCDASDSKVLTINGGVVADAGVDKNICLGQSVTLSAATVTGGMYEWRENGSSTILSTMQNYSVTPTSTKSYILTVRNNGCEDSDDGIVNVNLLPVAAATNDGPLTCSKTSVLLTATGGGTYSWSGGGTGATKSVTVAGTYTVTVTSSAGCTATASTVVGSNTGKPTPIASNDGPLTCLKTSVILSVTPVTGVTYAWSGGGTNQTKTVTVAGTYTVTVTNISNGCSETTTTIVTQNITTPSASASNDGPLTCSKTSVVMTALPASGVTYAWSGGGTNQTKTVSVAGTYTVTVTSTTNGCSATASTVVESNTGKPTPIASNDGPLTCSKTSVVLSVTPVTGVTYVWSGGGTNQTKTVTVAGTYTVTVTNISNGCSETATTTVTQNITTPTPTASNDGPLTCIKTTVVMTALPATGVTYAWSGGGTNQTKSVTVPGTYTVTVTNNSNGCTATASTIVLQDITNPTPSASNDGPLTCSKTTVVMTALPATGVTYAWSGGGTNQTKSVTIPGTYTVTVTNNSNGCSATASTIVLQDITNPTPSASNDGPLTCSKTTVVMTALPATGVTYAWSGGGTNQTKSVTVPGTYTVTVTNNSNGCSATASTIVLQDITNPTPSASNDGPLTCSKTTVVMTALPATGVTYAWSGGGTNQTKSVTVPGTYTVTVTIIQMDVPLQVPLYCRI
ncbi:MAG: hypothetical protein IPO92_10225 [Saprospiraceae bacterium]|nr:hypothetical protein [Saprospiraceae bacterium]